MRLIDADDLKEHKFVSINCYLKSNVDNGFPQYKQGWNDAIDAIIDNAPTVDAYTEDDVKTAIKEGHEVGYEMAKAKYERPTQECKPYQCDYYDFAKRIIDGIVDVMRTHGMESLEDINSELDRMNKVLGGNNDE